MRADISLKTVSPNSVAMTNFAWVILTAVLFSAGQAKGASCSVNSPAHKVALVELYTSEGCSSCPPADRWLNSLTEKGFSADQVVPLAFHVDYWNYLGWSDPFSQSQFSIRQREAARLNRNRVVYTPQVMLQGADYPGWVSGARFSDAVSVIKQQPVHAQLSLNLLTELNSYTLTIKGFVDSAVARSAVQVFIVLYENQLITQVLVGENAGRTLNHDHVVRILLGPFQVSNDGFIDIKRVVALEKSWNPARLGAAAFVQGASSGNVLQAVMLAPCSK